MKMRKMFDVMQREKWKTNVYNLLTLLEIRVFLFGTSQIQNIVIRNSILDKSNNFINKMIQDPEMW